MTTEKPSEAILNRFERDLSKSADYILETFEWLGLPEGEQLDFLKIEIKDAVCKAIRPWL
jgi:hypothetical protein